MQKGREPMLFLTPILDVAIGFILIFSLLALLVTQINAVIGTILKWRARQLREGLQMLLTDPQLQVDFLKHPLIKMILPETLAQIQPQAQAQGWDAQEMVARIDPERVTHIPSAQFVEALLSVLRDRVRNNQTNVKALEEAIEEVADLSIRSDLRMALRRYQEQPGMNTLLALRQVIEPVPNNAEFLRLYSLIEKALPLALTPGEGLTGVLQGLNTIRDEDLKKVLETAISAAKSMDDAKIRLAAWFNDGMDRTSVMFKAKMQWITVGVSALLVILLNADTLHIARTLWQTPEMRQSVALVAQTYVASGVLEQNLAAAQASLNEDGLTLPPSTESNAQQDAAVSPALQGLLEDLEAAGATLQQIGELQLPIGWEYVVIDQAMIDTYASLGLPDPRTNARNLWNLTSGNPDFLSNWLRKIVGFVTAILAVSLGAPFWFDLLRRVTRSAPAASAG